MDRFGQGGKGPADDVKADAAGFGGKRSTLSVLRCDSSGDRGFARPVARQRERHRLESLGANRSPSERVDDLVGVVKISTGRFDLSDPRPIGPVPGLRGMPAFGVPGGPPGLPAPCTEVALVKSLGLCASGPTRQ